MLQTRLYTNCKQKKKREVCLAHAAKLCQVSRAQPTFSALAHPHMTLPTNATPFRNEITSEVEVIHHKKTLLQQKTSIER